MRGTFRNNRNPNRSASALVDPVDVPKLNAFFKHELAFYNTLVTAFSSRTRGHPGMILDITPAQSRLMAALAEHGLDIRELVKDRDAWPKSLQGLEHVVFDANNRVILDPNLRLLFEEISKHKFVVIPETKRIMVESFIEFYKTQADILNQPQKSEIMEIAYRAAPANLAPQEFSVKRHAQIPKNSVKWQYSNEHEHTLMAVPLASKPIVLPHFNLNEHTGWQTLILKQESGRYTDHNTPWLADFKATQGKYLLKYVDIGR